MKKNLSKPYDEDFYSAINERTSKSAAVVLGLLYEHYKPRSVIDVGCAEGAWLATAESLGSKILKGIDGEWVREEALLSKNIDFMTELLKEAYTESTD